MIRRNRTDPCELGIALIEEQLLALVLYASTVANWIDNGKTPPDLAAANSLLRRKRSRTEPQTHIEDGTSGVEGEILGLGASWAAFHRDPKRLSVVLRVASTNAILAVADFFEAHDLSGLRTPEVQFLMRIRDAAANGNTFRIEVGERIPVASFHGLVINGVRRHRRVAPVSGEPFARRANLDQRRRCGLSPGVVENTNAVAHDRDSPMSRVLSA
jgi:hypothetical protein